MKGLISLKKEKKERVHNFTQRFVSYLNNFSAADKPSERALIEYYTLALEPDIAMFSKRSVRPTLVDTYEEAEKVEAELESIEHYPTQSDEKTYGNKKPQLLTKTKDERSQELDGVLKMMQKLSYRVINLEKETRGRQKI